LKSLFFYAEINTTVNLVLSDKDPCLLLRGQNKTSYASFPGIYAWEARRHTYTTATAQQRSIKHTWT